MASNSTGREVIMQQEDWFRSNNLMIPVSRQGLTSRNLWSRAPKGQKRFSEDYCHSTSSTLGSWQMQNPKSSWTYLQEGNSPFWSQPGFDDEYQVSLLFSNKAINKGSLIINWPGILCLPYILCLVFSRQISNDRSKRINNSKKIDQDRPIVLLMFSPLTLDCYMFKPEI